MIGPPAHSQPAGALSKAIDRDFGSFDTFLSKFTGAAVQHFGSGWAFLVVDPSTKKLELMTTPNQDSVPLHGKPGLLACDVWERSYYLRHQNRRADYLKAWWKVVNWPAVTSRYQHFLEGRQQL